MNYKYKIGDKVRIIEDNGYPITTNGSEGIIVNLYEPFSDEDDNPSYFIDFYKITNNKQRWGHNYIIREDCIELIRMTQHQKLLRK